MNVDCVPRGETKKHRDPNFQLGVRALVSVFVGARWVQDTGLCRDDRKCHGVFKFRFSFLTS